MAIVNDDVIKVVQAVVLPDTVEALNVFYFVCDFQAEQSEEDVVAECEAWIENIYGAIDGNMSDGAAMGLMQVYEWVAGAPPEWNKIGEGTPDVTFADVTEMLPHGCSALIRAYTTRGKTIGRKYFPAFTENAQEDGSWVSGCLANLATASGLWGSIGAIDPNNALVPGVYSATTQFVHELTDEFVIPVHPGYQRRRRPGVGS